MKTTVSILNEVFELGEQLARQLGQSRSQVYTSALKSYLAKKGGDAITKKLDKVYGDEGTGSSQIDPLLRKLQAKTLS